MKKHYIDPDGSKFPVGSPEYTKWLDSLEPIYKELMLQEIRDRARQAQQKQMKSQ
jgi:hypothetical protein